MTSKTIDPLIYERLGFSEEEKADMIARMLRVAASPTHMEEKKVITEVLERRDLLLKKIRAFGEAHRNLPDWYPSSPGIDSNQAASILAGETQRSSLSDLLKQLETQLEAMPQVNWHSKGRRLPNPHTPATFRIATLIKSWYEAKVSTPAKVSTDWGSGKRIGEFITLLNTLNEDSGLDLVGLENTATRMIWNK